MANDGQIVFEVTADGKHAIADIKEITRAIQQETGKWDNAAKESTDNISNSFSGMLKKLVAGFSAAKIGKALLDIGKDALNAASDLKEVQNVVDTTFGNNASKIEQWAKNAGTQFGLTETKAKQFTSTLGAMLKSSGMAGDEIVDMSTDLAGLAADMSSFYNLDFDEAFQKIRSGISGETEPLKQLGINMSVANLNAFALQQGLEKTFDKMSQGEQTMLRYQYLMSATADAQGDFSKTSTEYANSLRNLESNIAAIKTALGQTFYDAISKATNWLNEFLALLIPKEEQKTVIDDFEQVQIDTEGKLAQIREVATEATLLTDELDKINKSKIGEAGTKVQEFVDGLAKIDLKQDKVSIVTGFLNTLASDSTILEALTGKDAEGAAEWLRTIGEAATSLNENNADGWAKLVESIKEGLPGLEDTDFGQQFFAALGAGFGEVSKETSALDWVIGALGDKTNRTADEQALWLATCKQLVKTIPGLSSIINTETGEIKGGTNAVREYIKAWEEGQTKLAYLQMHEQKGSLLEQAFADLPELKLNFDMASWRMKKAYDEVKSIYKDYGQNLVIGADGTIDLSNFSGVTDEEMSKLKAFKAEVEGGLSKAYAEAQQAYTSRKQAYEEALKMYEEEGQMISDLFGEEGQKTNQIKEWSDESKEAAKTIVANAHDSLTALADYVQGVRDSVRSAVDGIVKGFSSVHKAGHDLREESAELAGEETEALNKYSAVLSKWTTGGVVDLEKMAKNYNNLSKEEQEAYNALAKIHNKQKEVNEGLAQYTAEGMKAGLQDQLTYMTEYLDNLKKAQEMGLSAELLASLSDGSTESAEYLAGLVAGGKDAAQEVDKVFKQVQAKKKEFSNTLADQQLTVDEVYKKMQEDALAAVKALDMKELASENTGKTVEGLAAGIRAHVSDVASAVDAVIAELDRLTGLGIFIDFDANGIPIVKPTTKKKGGKGKGGDYSYIGSAEVGLDYVPFNGYLSILHEGEGILTAEENKVWQDFKNGGNGVDYDTMGNVVRDNSRGGGNVYLDGRIVGSVISEQQGKSYRQLKRSGWQG